MFNRILILSLVFQTSIIGAQDAKLTDEGIAGYVSRFNKIMEAKAWEAAQYEAIRAAKEFGDEHPLVNAMLINSYNALAREKGHRPLQTPRVKPQADPVVARTYDLQKLPVWTMDGKRFSSTLLKTFLETEVGAEQMPAVKLLAYPKEKAVVAVCPSDLHKKLSLAFEKLEKSD